MSRLCSGEIPSDKRDEMVDADPVKSIPKDEIPSPWLFLDAPALGCLNQTCKSLLELVSEHTPFSDFGHAKTAMQEKQELAEFDGSERLKHDSTL